MFTQCWNNRSKKTTTVFPETLKCLIKNVRVIFHLAGVSTGSGYSPPNEYLVRNNVLATRGLIRAIRQYCTFPPLVILLSSIHVYKKSVCYTEATELTPLSFYGLTKLTQELLLQTAPNRRIYNPSYLEQLMSTDRVVDQITIQP